MSFSNIKYSFYIVSCLYTKHTIATKVDHDVRLAVHDAGESERRDITPNFEGSEESIIDDFLIQVRSVTQYSTKLSQSSINETDKENRAAHFAEHVGLPLDLLSLVSIMENKLANNTL